MGIRLIFLNPMVVTDDRKLYMLNGLWCGSEVVPGNSSIIRTVPQTDTGGQVEHTEALVENDVEGTRQIAPVTSGEGGPPLRQLFGGGTDQGVADCFIKNTGLCGSR